MDYLNEAFGPFRPHIDEDASLKLCIDSLLADHRIQELVDLAQGSGNLAGVAGEPGWRLQRWDEGQADKGEGRDKQASFYSFRASVDPDAYELAHPEFFMDLATLRRYTVQGLRAYIKFNPSRASDLNPILDSLTDVL